MLVTNPLIDVVIDATGKPGVAADYDLMAMEHGKHLVMMNVEADVTIGPYLKQQADRLGVDLFGRRRRRASSSCMELIEFASALGLPHRLGRQGQEQPAQPRRRARRLSRGSDPPEHEPAHAGRVRRRLKDHGRDVRHRQRHRPRPRRAGHARPQGRPRRDGQGADPQARMAASSTRRASSTSPSARAWRPASSSSSRPSIRASSSAWTISISASGPYYSFFRPYHLTSLEVPLTAARIMLYGKPDMVPLPNPVAEVCAVAKRDLARRRNLRCHRRDLLPQLHPHHRRRPRPARRAGRPARRRQGDRRRSRKASC